MKNVSDKNMNLFLDNQVLFHEIYNNMSDACFIISVEQKGEKKDPVFRYMMANKQAYQLVGPKTELEGKSFQDILSEEQTASVLKHYLECVRLKKQITYEDTIEEKDFFGETKLTPIFHKETGQVEYILAVVRDITNRKMQEIEIEQSHEMLEAFVEGSADSILIANPNGVIVRTNRAFEKLFGWEEEEVIGQNTRDIDIIPEGLFEEHVSIINDLKNGVSLSGYETIRLSKYGQVIDVSATFSPVFNEEELVFIAISYRDISESKRSDQLLEESRQWYKSLFTHHPDAVYSFDLKGNFTSANPAIEYITGYKEEELIGKSFLPLLVPEDVGTTLLHFYKATNGEPISYEIKIKHKDGREIHVEIQNIPIIVKEQVVGVFGVAKDITKEIEAEEELNKAKRELETFWNYSADPIFMFDGNRDIVKTNPAFHRVFGWNEEEIIGPNPKGSIIPKHMYDEPKIFEERLRHGETITNYETKRVTKDGVLIDVLASYTPIQNKHRKNTGVVAFLKDITELKRRQEEIRQGESKYKLITENMSDLIAVLSPDGTVTYGSPSYKKVLGINPEDYYGQNASGIISDDFLEESQEKFEEMYVTKKSFTTEISINRENIKGNRVILESEVIPVFNEQDKLKHVIVVSRDITERKKAEAALRASDELFTLIATYSSDVIKISNPNGVLMYASPAHQKVYGYEPDHFVGQSLFFEVHEEDITELHQAFIGLVVSKVNQQIEIRQKHKNGSWIWMDVKMQPVFNGHGDLENIVIVARNTTDRKQLEEQLEQLAYHDSLTGLPNRRIFNDRLLHGIRSAKRNKHRLALLTLDCDKFKRVNDTYGHDAGDAVIIEFAKRLTSSVRETDTVTRVGGDEFQIILHHLHNEEEAYDIAERILEKVVEPIHFQDHTLHISTSIGIAFYPIHGEDEETLIKFSDEALYLAKEAGRNTYKVYEEGEVE